MMKKWIAAGAAVCAAGGMAAAAVFGPDLLGEPRAAGQAPERQAVEKPDGMAEEAEAAVRELEEAYTELDLTFSDADYSVGIRDGKQEDALAALYDLHEAFNNITGYGAVEVFAYDNIQDEDAGYEGEYYGDMTENIYYMSEHLLEPSLLQHDIDKGAELFIYGVQQENQRALRYAHRIFHDLDVHLNHGGEESGEDIWHVTETFGKESVVETMHSALNGN